MARFATAVVLHHAMLAACVSFAAAAPVLAQVDIDGDGVSWPVDCNDGWSGSRPGQFETCDGFDNACSGAADPGCVRTCAAALERPVVSLGAAGSAAAAPRTAAHAKGADVVWVDRRHGNSEIYLARLDRWGARRYDDLRVSNTAAESAFPALAGSGAWRAIVWVEGGPGSGDIHFRRVRDGGLGDGVDIPLIDTPTDETEPALVWAGREWGLAYAKGNRDRQVVLARVFHSGSVVADVAVSSKQGSARRPAVAWSGNGYGVVWEDARAGASEIWFRSFDPDLQPTSDETRLTDAAGESGTPSVAWAGSAFLVAWLDRRDASAEVYVAAFGPGGARLGPDRRITALGGDAGPPRISWTGAEAVVVFDDADVSGRRPFLARLSAEGTIVEGPRAVGSAAAGVGPGDVAWLGGAPALVWPDTATGLLAWSRAACCGDADGDGADLCGGDCDDGRGDVHPGALDACNGIDDDCDGDLDEACPRYCGGPDLNQAPRLHGTGTAASVGPVSLAWNGSVAAAVWSETPSGGGNAAVVFQSLAADGAPVGPPVPLANVTGRDERCAAIAARPGGWVVFHCGDEGINTSRHALRLLDDAGNETSPATVWTESTFGRPDNAEIAWTGRGFAVAYDLDAGTSGALAGLRFLSPEGRPVDSLYHFAGDEPGLAWTGSEIAVAVSGTINNVSGIWLYRFDPGGRSLAPPRRVDVPPDGYAHHLPDLAWAGDGFGLVYVSNWSRIMFHRLDAAGAVVSTRILDDTYYDYHGKPEIAWNGEEFFVQWTLDETPRTIEALRLDTWGNARSVVLALSPPGDPVGTWLYLRTGLVGVGTGFLTGWPRSPDPTIATRRVGCCPNGDPDVDGSCLEDCDDGDAQTYPGAVELCDGADNDCDGARGPEESDLDGDGALACVDCDDTNALRHPGARELCNGLDENCDGRATDETPFAPVTGVRFVSKETFVWDAVPGSPVYDAQRGALLALRASAGDFATATDACVGWNGYSTSAGDPTIPPEGEGYFYSVAAGAVLCNGTHDDGPGLVAPRDEGMILAPRGCP